VSYVLNNTYEYKTRRKEQENKLNSTPVTWTRIISRAKNWGSRMARLEIGNFEIFKNIWRKGLY